MLWQVLSRLKRYQRLLILFETTVDQTLQMFSKQSVKSRFLLIEMMTTMTIHHLNPFHFISPFDWKQIRSMQMPCFDDYNFAWIKITPLINSEGFVKVQKVDLIKHSVHIFNLLSEKLCYTNKNMIHSPLMNMNKCFCRCHR